MTLGLHEMLRGLLLKDSFIKSIFGTEALVSLRALISVFGVILRLRIQLNRFLELRLDLLLVAEGGL